MENRVVIDDFTVLQTRFNKKSTAGHCLYIKQHNVHSEECKPRDRTLLILNIPPYCDHECLSRLFSNCGRVTRVYLHETPNSKAPPINESEFFKTVADLKGFKVGYVVFKNAGSIEKALRLPYDEPLILSTKEHPLQTGMKKWCAEYAESCKVDISGMQEEINTWLADYDKRVEEEKQREKAMDGVPDEDGWITVTKHGRNKGIPRTEAHEKRTLAKEAHRRKQKELLNFYAFQVRESKKEHIAQLRQKFEEDKQKIALMKAARKFKPY